MRITTAICWTLLAHHVPLARTAEKVQIFVQANVCSWFFFTYFNPDIVCSVTLLISSLICRVTLYSITVNCFRF